MPDAITASPSHSLAGNSADYREIDQAPRKDVAVCVSGMSEEGNQEKCYLKTPKGLRPLCHLSESLISWVTGGQGGFWMI